MSKYKFSTPNLKIRVKSIRYTMCGATVHCFMTFEPMRRYDDPYMNLVGTAEILGMKYAKHTQFCSSDTIGYVGSVSSNSDKYIYIPSDYEYHGMASLKAGDVSDIEVAKRIAYKKAYRQFVNFYYNCYFNLYNYVMAYARDVWYEQMSQLADRWQDANSQIFELVEREE